MISTLKPRHAHRMRCWSLGLSHTRRILYRASLFVARLRVPTGRDASMTGPQDAWQLPRRHHKSAPVSPRCIEALLRWIVWLAIKRDSAHMLLSRCFSSHIRPTQQFLRRSHPPIPSSDSEGRRYRCPRHAQLSCATARYDAGSVKERKKQVRPRRP
ncbi:hypothetical protein BV20DRAFT_421834 [Pilatotrama ljubarskyi]|nr:hypothetical protein BV20DRAFT_421834 [Pilatotrama ljubarskyi]